MTLLSSEIAIDAPSVLGSQVLVDFDSYPESISTRFQQELSGVLTRRSDDRLAFRSYRTPRTFKARIIETNPLRALAWKGHIVVPETFDVRHHFEIDSLDDDRSRLRQYEYFSSLLIPFMRGVLRHTRPRTGKAGRRWTSGHREGPASRGCCVA